MLVLVLVLGTGSELVRLVVSELGEFSGAMGMIARLREAADSP